MAFVPDLDDTGHETPEAAGLTSFDPRFARAMKTPVEGDHALVEVATNDPPRETAGVVNPARVPLHMLKEATSQGGGRDCSMGQASVEDDADRLRTAMACVDAPQPHRQPPRDDGDGSALAPEAGAIKVFPRHSWSKLASPGVSAFIPIQSKPLHHMR